jgi:hypothetical protein
MVDQADVEVVVAPAPKMYGWVIQRTDADGLYLMLGRGGQRWGSWVVPAVHFVRRADAQGYVEGHCVSVPVEVVRDVR